MINKKVLTDIDAWHISDNERIQLLRAEVDRLRAEVERLREEREEAWEEAERLEAQRDEARAEVERLRADNDLWLQARNDALAGGDALKEELARLRALYEKGVVALVMIERMAAGGIYSQESIHATAVAAIKDLWGEGDGR